MYLAKGLTSALLLTALATSACSTAATAPLPAPPAPPPPAARVHLTVRSQPAGATVVRADGVSLGTTPLTYEVEPSPGRVDFLLKLPGYQDSKVALPVDHDNETQVQLALAPRRPAPRARTTIYAHGHSVTF